MQQPNRLVRPNRILEALQNNRPSLGGWCMTGAPASAEIMAQGGFDWVCVDTEHSPMDESRLTQLIAMIAASGAEPVVRLPLLDEVAAKKSLDAGARGLIFPMITTAEQARQVIEFSRFPPLGKRSYSLSRASAYGSNKTDYFTNANQTTFVAIMIEHVDALPHLDAILSTQGIDAVLVGPYDLSGSLGIPGAFEDPRFIQTLKTINDAVLNHKIPQGLHEVHPTREILQAHVAAGYRFIGCGIDTLFIANVVSSLLPLAK